MKTKRRIRTAALLAILMALVVPASVLAAEPAEQSRAVYDSTGDYFSKLTDSAGLQVGSTGGEWIVIGLARSGRMTEEQIETYYETAAQFVDDNANDKEQLHRAKSTENSRLILALTAIGKDVTDVNGHNLLKGLSDQEYLETQGINGPIWALIALDSNGYEIPAVAEGGTQASRESIIEWILAAQLEDGLWGLNGMKSDSDTTGMVIQALAPYYDLNDRVQNAVDTALAGLSALQKEDGSFISTGFFGGAANAESVAQVVVALTALGIDPHTDARFVKNGHSVVDALCAFAVEGGGFCHVAGGERNGMASEQGYYALAAYFRFLDGKTSLYDMSDLKSEAQPGESVGPETQPGESVGPETQPGESVGPETQLGESVGPETQPRENGSTNNTQPDQTTTSPQMGDHAHIARYLCLLCLSLIGIAVTTGMRKRANRN